MTNGSGGLIVQDNGKSGADREIAAAGKLTATVSIGSAGADIRVSGTFSLEANTNDESVNETVEVTDEDGVELDLPAGPYLRVQASNVDLTVLEQTLTGDFAVEIKRDENGVNTLQVGANNVSLTVSQNGTQLLSVTNGSGGLIVQDNGKSGADREISAAGKLTATVSIGSAGADIRVSGTFSLEANTNDESVNETVEVTDEDGVELDLPAGPYLRVQASNVDLTVLEQTLTGDFAVEIKRDENGVNTLQVGANNASLTVSQNGTELLSVTNGSGGLIVQDNGKSGADREIAAAGKLTATVSIGSAGADVRVSGTFSLEANTNDESVNETVEVTDEDGVELDLPAGPYLRVQASNVDLTVLEQTLTGDFAVEIKRDENGVNTLQVGANNVSLTVSQNGTQLLSVTNGSGGLIVQDNGKSGADREISVAAQLTATLSTGTPDSDVQLTGTAILEINSADEAVTATIQTSSDSVEVELRAGPYLRLAGEGLSIKVLGQSLTGNVVLDVTRDGEINTVRLGAAEVELVVSDGTAEILSVTGGSAAFISGENGFGGAISGRVTASLPGVALNGQFTLEVSTSSQPISTSFEVSSGTSATLDLPAGPFVRFTTDPTNALRGAEAAPLEDGANTATLEILGVVLRGEFTLLVMRSVGTDAGEVHVSARNISPGGTDRPLPTIERYAGGYWQS